MALSQIQISCPSELSATSSALQFSEQMRSAGDTPLLILDFRRLRFAKPFATLLVAQTIREVAEARRLRGLKTRYLKSGFAVGERSAAIDYLGHVGFFEYAGIEFGNQPGEALGSSTYLPITVLSRTDLEARYPGEKIQEAVTLKCRRLAALLSPDEAERDVMMYCFREIVRNVFEHAETDQCTLMAQKYSGDLVQIAIADEGIGVPTSLAKAHAFSSTEEALRAALRPGVSSNLGGQTGDKWDNTGYGLFVASELGKATGSFCIISGGTLLNVSGAGETIFPFPLRGTAVRLTVSTADAEYFSNRLQQIVEEGERLAALDPNAITPASLSTRLKE
jgi:hypothetical protein